MYSYLETSSQSTSTQQGFPLCTHLQREGDAAQESVIRGVIDDALTIQLALYTEMDIQLHPGEAHSYQGVGVVHLLVIGWWVLVITTVALS